MSRDECAANAAAYVLGALEPDEVEAYQRHLSTCATCRDELATLEPVAEVLPLAAPQHPVPDGLRRRVMSVVQPDSPKVRPRLRLRLRPVPALASAAVAVAVAIVVAIAVSGGTSSPRIIHATVHGSTGTAELRITGTRGDLIVRDMPAPSAGHIYEVWLARSTRPPVPANALFGVTSDGAANVGIPAELGGVSEVLVTQEPAGGSRAPTGPAVIVAPTS